jgi:hypothetical protein
METDTVGFKKAESACKWFLNTYTEDSTTRVSKEAFTSVVDIIHAAMDEEHRKVCKRAHHFPMVEPVYHRIDKHEVIVVVMNLQSKEFRVLREKRDEVERRMGAFEHLPFELYMLLTAHAFIRMKEMTLEELEAWGIRPYMMVSSLSSKLDHLIFKDAVEHSTMAPAEA